MSHGISIEERHRMIAEAAYYLAEIRDFAPGDTLRDWFEAEAEIDRRLAEQENVKRNFHDRLRTQIAEWDAKLDEMKLKSKEATAELSADYEKHLETLVQKREIVQAKMQSLLQHTGEAWEDLKVGTEKAWEDMRNSLEQIVSRFKQK